MSDTLTIVSLDDLKAHLNVTSDDDNGLLTTQLGAARGYVEGWCGPLDDFTTGVPPALVQAMKMYVAHLYENRESTSFAATASEMPMGFFDLIGPWRKWSFGA